MDIMKRIDPELAPALEMIPADGSLNFDDINAARKMSDEIFGRMVSMMPVVKGVISRDVNIPGPKGAPDITARVYTPENQSGKRPGMLWIHGGGYILGDLTADDYTMRSMCVNTGCIMVSTNYRLAPENPFPAPVEDCYASLKWMVNNAEELGIDKTRVAIGGGSAAAGLQQGLRL
jgi:acetyl esterase/lipase